MAKAVYNTLEATDEAFEQIARLLREHISLNTNTEYIKDVNVIIGVHKIEDDPCIVLRKTSILDNNIPGFFLDVYAYITFDDASYDIELKDGEYENYYDNLKEIQNKIIVPVLFYEKDKSLRQRNHGNERIYNLTDEDINLSLSITLTNNMNDDPIITNTGEARILFTFYVEVRHSEH